MEEHALSVLVLTFGPVPASLLAHHVDGETRLVQVRSREVRADEPVGGSVVVDWYGPAPAPHRLLCQVLRRMPHVLDGADGALLFLSDATADPLELLRGLDEQRRVACDIDPSGRLRGLALSSTVLGEAPIADLVDVFSGHDVDASAFVDVLRAVAGEVPR